MSERISLLKYPDKISGLKSFSYEKTATDYRVYFDVEKHHLLRAVGVDNFDLYIGAFVQENDSHYYDPTTDIFLLGPPDGYRTHFDTLEEVEMFLEIMLKIPSTEIQIFHHLVEYEYRLAQMFAHDVDQYGFGRSWSYRNIGESEQVVLICVNRNHRLYREREEQFENYKEIFSNEGFKYKRRYKGITDESIDTMILEFIINKTKEGFLTEDERTTKMHDFALKIAQMR